MASADRNTLEDLLPTAHWRIQVHRPIPASPAAAFAGIDRVRVDDLPIASTCTALTKLAAGFRGEDTTAADRPLIEHLYGRGWGVLELRQDEEIVLGQIGQFWRAGAPATAARSLDHFETIGEPGVTKAAMSLRIGSAGTETVAILDTRIVATDQRTHRRMSRHWQLSAGIHRLARRQFLDALAATSAM